MLSILCMRKLLILLSLNYFVASTYIRKTTHTDYTLCLFVKIISYLQYTASSRGQLKIGFRKECWFDSG